MTSSPDPGADIAPDSAASPAEAFEALRHELSLLHNAVAGLTAAREKIPDYRADFDELKEAIEDSCDRLAAIEQSPSLKLTPAVLTKEIVTAAKAARAEDERLLETARVSIHNAVGAINSIVQRGQAADRQHLRLVQAGIAGLLAGIVLWSFLPGAVARSLPASWHVPEWMAARTLGRTMPGVLPALSPTSVPVLPDKAGEARSTHRKAKTRD